MPINPGSTIGVLGSGQLGRMFAIAARQLGYRVHTFSPDIDTPTGQVSDLEITAPYEDLDAISKFASRVSAVTFEFENVPAATAAAIEAVVPVRPSGNILHTTQHRLREKNFLRTHGFPVTPFYAVRAPEEIISTGILKTAGFGYDGKGQFRITDLKQAPEAWQSLKTDEAVLEELVDFECEFSIVAARDEAGRFVHYLPSRNHHVNGILDISVSPFAAPPEAVEITRAIFETLDVVGVLCVEFFLTKSGAVIINELAPRPHNSGHLTIDACAVSQFEQQIRAVCGLPLGSTEMFRPAAMANLLGEMWSYGEPAWSAALKHPGVELHLYGKLEPRPGRKMGHLTATAGTAAEAERIVLSARTGVMFK
jgi:5-(carboxyamino)imidazole ribonucleotide synthase